MTTEQLTLLQHATRLLSERNRWPKEVSTKMAAGLLGVSDSQLNAAKRAGKLPFQVRNGDTTLEADWIGRNCWKVGFKQNSH
ncbi:MAG: hypothetical protein ACLFM4_15555 [Phormidium sp.]